MAQSASYDRRYLTADEFMLVQETRQASIGQLDNLALRDLLRRVRERRDRARDIASRKRREMRGKATPVAARAAGGNEGSRRKLDILSAALKRANKESSRRAAGNARSELVASARKALALRQEADDARTTPEYRTAEHGMNPHADHKGRMRDNVDEGSFVPQFHQSRGAR
jgi:hypothetical protein